jgi:hypothetical protein
VFLLGDVLDSFASADNSSAEEMLDKISFLSILFIVIGAGTWIAAYFSQAFLLIFSERVTKKIRVAYVRAILN